MLFFLVQGMVVMPWIFGIDEAGYGPNLGPFVMAAVGCHLPQDPQQTDLWQLLRGAVRRHKERDDGRLLIEDSKVVYGGNRGLKALERGVLAVLRRGTPPPELDLAGWLESLAAEALPYLQQECWYRGQVRLPVETDGDDLRHSADRFDRVCQRAEVTWATARSAIVCPPRFNGLLERAGTKSIVLLLSLAELLRENLHPEGSEPVYFCVDKHGGRNTYADILQQAIPEGRIVAEEEGRERSCYRIEGLSREYRVVFRPRAESSCLCVALASMLAKYLRELLMMEFNQFWLQHLPELKPTAGYPGDAARFLEAIRPVAARLGISEAVLWRVK
jgi:hypothetical protein